MENNKKEIIDLLKSTERPNIDKVINWLNQDPSFFVVPAAKRQHDNVKGGLAYHSLKVYKQAKADWDQQDDHFKNQYPLNSVIISSLLHDVCKKDVYYFDDEGRPQTNRANYDKGHGLRSVKLIEELGFELTNDERMAIWWHMGEGHEVSQPDYPREYNIAMQDPFCQLIHQADKKAADVPALYKITKKGCANEDCMVVAKNLIDQGLNPAILNMADAYHACGKYNTGANVRTIYRIALLNGHDSLVLGGFGCGVFKLEPEFVAELFKQILDENEFKGKFHTIAFALLEGPAGPRRMVEEEGNMAPFYNKFGRLQ